MRPRFTIIDGIIAMEGQGPGSGTPYELGSLFAAHDAVALDVALADRTGSRAAQRLHHGRLVHGRGLVDLDAPYELAGDPIEPDNALQARAPRPAGAAAAFIPPHGAQPHHGAAPAGGRGRLHALRRVRDDLRRGRDHALAAAGVRRRDCVRCYACTEVCPTAAIDNVTPRVARLLGARG